MLTDKFSLKRKTT